MEVGKVFTGSNNNMTNVLLHHDQVDSLWMTNSSPLHGSASMVNFDEKARKRPFLSESDKEEHENDDTGGCYRQTEKKRRLLPEQVQFLERCFEVENKLEPERKVQLAKEIGLQPRQVAIWFQNRRARYKTKLLEKEYDSLRANYDKLKADYDILLEENGKLKTEVQELQKRVVFREGKVKSEEPCDPTTTSVDAETDQNQDPKTVLKSVSIVACKQQHEDASCAKSDVIDSDSPHYYADGNHSSMLEPDDASNIFEPDLSDFSQDEDDNTLLTKRLWSAPSFPKLEVECFDDLQQSPCILGLPIEDHPAWFWNY